MPQVPVSPWEVRLLQLEHLAVDVIGQLEAAMVDVLLIKGPVTNRWLYGGADSRTFRDIDVLVRPSQREVTEAVLLCGGLIDVHRRMLPIHRPSHERTWRRGDLLLDVHIRLAGIPEPRGEAAFDLLWAGRDPLSLQGRSVQAPGEPARAMHLALHAAQSARDARALEDLDRGLDLSSFAVWSEALRMASELECIAAVMTGLRKSDRGQVMVKQSDLSARVTTDVVLRSRSASMEAQNLWEAMMRRPLTTALRSVLQLCSSRAVVSIPLKTRASAVGRAGLAIGEIGMAAIYAQAQRSYVRLGAKRSRAPG